MQSWASSWFSSVIKVLFSSVLFTILVFIRVFVVRTVLTSFFVARPGGILEQSFFLKTNT